MSIDEVAVGVFPPERFESVIPSDRFGEFMESVGRARDALEGRAVWNINSTASGGGVAEMLRSLLAYARGAGVDARWVVISGNPEFFSVTKRIHNNLHGAAGDGGELGDEERKIYEDALRPNNEELSGLVRADDVVIVHDPQPAGLIQPVKDLGATVIWRCHVGLDLPNDTARLAWDFLIPFVQPADQYIFSRRAFAWEGLETSKITVVAPSIDAFSPKNQDMDEATVAGILDDAGVIHEARDGSATFVRQDGSPGRVDRKATFHDGGDAPPAGVPLVVQVSRWDRLKDPVGVIQGFADHVADHTDAHLVMAGPAVEAVSDDPEGAEVLEESRAAWAGLSDDLKARVHLAALPMEDGEENAAMVNALQRRANVVVQKSLAEGFGLTVAEAMWKARPVVASRIGGIQDQIVEGVSGVLVSDPTDLAEFGEAVRDLLTDPDRATKMGVDAQERVRDEFLGPRHLMQYVKLIVGLLEG